MVGENLSWLPVSCYALAFVCSLGALVRYRKSLVVLVVPRAIEDRGLAQAAKLKFVGVKALQRKTPNPSIERTRSGGAGLALISF